MAGNKPPWICGRPSRACSIAEGSSGGLPAAGRICAHWLAPSPIAAWLFLRLLGLIYFAAFASLSVQVLGLFGSQGILPVTDYLLDVELALGARDIWQIPTLFWIDASDASLKGVCWLGMAFALAVIFDRWVRLGLAGCYLLYLSLVSIGQDFLAFQWDLFLLECGFIALFLGNGSAVVVWLYRWLIFRFMLMGGIVKLASGDPSWSRLTALRYHFETQPLPTPLAWYAHQLPDVVLRGMTGAVLAIELLVPVLVFLGWRGRTMAGGGFALLQIGIVLTGNYNFFNLLTLALCLFLVEERWLLCCLPAWVARWIEHRRTAQSGRVVMGLGAACLVANLLVCALLIGLPRSSAPPEALLHIARSASNFGLVNGYGPFAVMTVTRYELEIEGSSDGIDWKTYQLPYNPGGANLQLGWNIPHQPRLDWQFWFAALSLQRPPNWLDRLQFRLRTGSSDVQALFEVDPFQVNPPTQTRVVAYRLRFSTWEERAETGMVWRRERLGVLAEN